MNTTEPICNRAKLDTGKSCNYNCWFCYYKDRLDVEDDLQTILSRVDYLIECGIGEVDLSGGESSIHSRWFDILEYCNNKGLHISTVSNGSTFCNMDFLQRSVDAGLKEILFSLHGYDAESHDRIVGRGGAFTDIIKSIENANALGLVVRANCVVCSDNYLQLSSKYVELIHKFDILEVNFLTLNFWGSADVHSKAVSYDVVSYEIKKAIDALNIKYINVRYIPYCYMVNYEKYVCNTYQHIYDTYDWNMAVYDQRVSPREYIGSELSMLYKQAGEDRIRGYHKGVGCASCKYFYICDGMEKGLSQPVYPIAGSKIRDVVYCRGGFYADKRSNTNT